MEKVDYSISFEVSEEMIEVLIEMAGYGIGYWSDMGEIDDERRTYTVRDREGGITFVLTYRKLAEALVEVGFNPAYADHFVSQYARDALMQDDAGEIDADLADVVVQVAALGEVIFG